MIAMRAQLAPALLLLLVLIAAAAPLVPALTPEEIRDRKINGANKLYIMSADPNAYAGEKKPAPESKKEDVQKTGYVTAGAGAGLEPESKSEQKVLETKVNAEVKQMRKEAAYDDAVAQMKSAESKKEAPNKDVVQKTSYVTGPAAELKPESKSDEKVLETKVNAEVKQMRKEAAYDDALAEMKAKELKSKPKNTTDDAEDHAKEKKSEDDDGVEKKSKSKLDYSEDDAGSEKKEKKPKNKDDDDEEKKSKSKSDDDDDDDDKKEKKSKSKDDDDDDDDDEKEKKSKSKDEAEKKSKEKDEKKKSKSKNKEEDFDAVPVETKADESMPAADTPDGYAAPTKKTPSYQAPTTTTMSATDTPDGYLAPKKAAPKMSTADTPDGYVAPTTMSASDSPDGYVTSSKAQPAMSATDSPDGYLPATDSPDGDVPATDSPDGDVPASDSPDGYAAPSTKPKVNVQSFEAMVPRPVLDMLSPVVKSLCAKTRFPYSCETSIAKLPETSIVPARQKDGLGVLTLAVDAVRAKITEARTAAKDLAADPRIDKISKSAINDCMAMYDDINTSYDTAMAALKRGDKATAATAFDAARTFVDTCDQGFLDHRSGLKPVIAGEEKILAELSSNVLAINKYM